MRYFRMLLGLLTLSSCVRQAEEVSAVDNLTSRFASEVRKEHGLMLFGTGRSFSKGTLVVGFNFSTERPTNVQEARKLIYVILEKMLLEIDQDPVLHAYLDGSQATLQNVRLGILFESSDRASVLPNTVSTVMVGQDELFSYDKWDPITGRLIAVHEETFDEAKRILENEFK